MLNSGGLDGPVFKSSLGPFCMAFPVYTPPVAPTAWICFIPYPELDKQRKKGWMIFQKLNSF